jgi:hypothetical protein
VTATLPTPPPRLRGVARPVTHVAGAGALGIVAAVMGVPVALAGLFGGVLALLVGLALVSAVVALLGVGLDTATGPERDGSVARGITLGVLGTGTVAVLGLIALRQDVGDGLPVPLRYAAAALPFVAIAGLQWRGWLRIGTVAVLAVTAAVLGVPRGLEAAQENRAALIATEVGTTARPWVTQVDGLHALPPQTTGSGYLWTVYADEDETPVVHLLRMDDGVVLGGDPCTAAFYTPEGDFTVDACTTADGLTWLRSAEGYWQQLVRRVDGTWLGATARPGVPQELLDQALAHARPMTEDEYDAWLDEILPSPAGY